MENLVEKIAAYERCVDGLIERIGRFEKFVTENVPEEFLKDFGFRNFWGYYSLHQDGNIIPSSVEKCGTFFYWGGDFSKGCYRASRKQVIEFAKSLPDLIKKAEKLAEKRLEEINKI